MTLEELKELVEGIAESVENREVLPQIKQRQMGMWKEDNPKLYVALEQLGLLEKAAGVIPYYRNQMITELEDQGMDSEEAWNATGDILMLSPTPEIESLPVEVPKKQLTPMQELVRNLNAANQAYEKERAKIARMRERQKK